MEDIPTLSIFQRKVLTCFIVFGPLSALGPFLTRDDELRTEYIFLLYVYLTTNLHTTVGKGIQQRNCVYVDPENTQRAIFCLISLFEVVQYEPWGPHCGLYRLNGLMILRKALEEVERSNKAVEA